MCVYVCMFFRLIFQNLNLSSHSLDDFKNKSTKLLNLTNQTITTSTRGEGRDWGWGEVQTKRGSAKCQNIINLKKLTSKIEFLYPNSKKIYLDAQFCLKWFL